MPEKIGKVLKNIVNTFADIADVPQEEIIKSAHLTQDEIKVLKDSNSDLNILMGELREKFSKCTMYNEKVQILTLKPNSWTYDKIKSFFGQKCTDHMIKPEPAKRRNLSAIIFSVHSREVYTFWLYGVHFRGDVY